jgi:hypothetical protein
MTRQLLPRPTPSRSNRRLYNRFRTQQEARKELDEYLLQREEDKYDCYDEWVGPIIESYWPCRAFCCRARDAVVGRYFSCCTEGTSALGWTTRMRCTSRQ